MSTLEFTVLDLDFPVGSMNKTATLVTGEQEAMPVDAGFTRVNAIGSPPRSSIPARSSPPCSSATATRDYLIAFEEELATAADGAALTDALIKRCPRPRHADRRPERRQGRQGEMTWG